MKKLRLPLLALIACLCFCACQPPTTKPKTVNATISGVEWRAYNIDRSFWSNPTASTTHLYYSFWIDFSGSLSARDIASAKILLQDGSSWTLDPSSEFDSEYNSLDALYYPDKNDVLPLCPMKAVVVLSDGTSLSKSFVTTPPNYVNSMQSSFSYLLARGESLYTYDSGTCRYELDRPILSSGVYSSSGPLLTLSFSTSDPDNNIYNGLIAFYDGSGKYVGKTSSLGNTGNNPSPKLNAGGGFKRDGTSNTYATNGNDISFASGYTLASIYEYRVFILDGRQYAGGSDNGNADHEAISALGTVTH